MEAPKTVLDSSVSFNSSESLRPRRGVLTLTGYGISVKVERGHLTIEDGIGSDRRRVRLARIGHKLERLVIVGLDGFVSLAALRWLADQGAALVMLERDGKVLLVTGPARPSDVRVRRAQALAHQNGLATDVSRDLIAQKLEEQGKIATEIFQNARAEALIAAARQALYKAHTPFAIGGCEARGAMAYWRLWEQIPITFPRGELHRVPEHWRRFDARGSPLTGSPRLAATPVNAVLNYLYAILEAEARLAAAAVGLDPEMGFLHADLTTRDSLAADLMEPVRPHVDAYVLRWLTSQPLRRAWFFETGSGHCRLTASCLEILSGTSTTWARALAPVVERVHQAVWAMARGTKKERRPATTLTQRRRREMWGSEPLLASTSAPAPPAVCRECGEPAKSGQLCSRCKAPLATARLIEGAKKGREAARRPESKAKMAAARRRIRHEERQWHPSQLPAWLTEQFYVEKVKPQLVDKTNRDVMLACGLSREYVVRVRHGRVTPHPRHWSALARLVGAITGS